MEFIFAKRLRELMKKQGLTQLKLAQKLGVGQKTISSWLSEKTEPRAASLCLLADCFGVEVDYLIGLKDD